MAIKIQSQKLLYCICLALLTCLISGSTRPDLSLAAAAQTLDNFDNSIISIDKLVGSPVQPFAHLVVTNKQPNQAIALTVQPGTILHPTTNADKYFDLVLTGIVLTLPAGKQSEFDLTAYQGSIKPGSRVVADSSVKYEIQPYTNNKSSKPASQVLARATDKAAGDNAVQLGLWMALDNLTFDQLTKYFAQDIRSLQKEAEFYSGANDPTPTSPVTVTTVSANTTTVPLSTTLPVANTTAGSLPTVPPILNQSGGTDSSLLLIGLIAALAVLVVILLIVVLVVLNRRKSLPMEQSSLDQPPASPGRPTGSPVAQANQQTRVQGTQRSQPGGYTPNGNRSTWSPEPGENTEHVDDSVRPTPGLGPNPAEPASVKTSPPDDDDDFGTEPFDEQKANSPTSSQQSKVLLQVENNEQYIKALTTAKKPGFELNERNRRVILSRGKINLLIFSDPSISSPHAILEFADKDNPLRLFVTDLASLNGTIVRDSPRLDDPALDVQLRQNNGRLLPGINRDFELKPDRFNKSKLRFGLVNFVYDYKTQVLTPEDGSGRLKPVKLAGQKKWVISRYDVPILELNVPTPPPPPDLPPGTGKNSKYLYSGDGLISTPHAMLEIDGYSYKLQDLNSKNGVYLENGQNLTKTGKLLSLGDRFHLGSYGPNATRFYIKDLRVGLEAVPDPVPGYTIEIKNPLGSGGMGMVYRCINNTDKKWYALKLPHPDKFQKEQYFGMWRNENAAMARLSTNEATKLGIVTIKSFGIIKQLDLPYYLMDLVQGVTLRQIVANSKVGMNESQVAYIVQQLLHALAWIHTRAGLVHCDVSDGNVMIDKDGKVWLTDFGIATPVGARVPSFANKRVAPPELLEPGRVVTETTDLYFVGVLMYQLAENSNGAPPQVSNPAAQQTMAVPITQVVGNDGTAQVSTGSNQTNGNGSVYTTATEVVGMPGPVYARPAAEAPIGSKRKLDFIRAVCLERDQTKRYQSANEVLDKLKNVGLLEKVALDNAQAQVQALVRETLNKLGRS